MTFNPTAIAGLWKIDLAPVSDERGWLVRTFCEETFARHGLNVRWPQASSTRTRLRGTVRGMHWQAGPSAEVKLLRCSRGAVWDVVVDVRPGSPTLGRWVAFELSENVPSQLYIPAGCAHGFQSLTDDVELHYQMSTSFVPELSRGFRWDDPAVGIPWPLPVSVVSARDKALPSFVDVTGRPVAEPRDPS